MNERRRVTLQRPLRDFEFISKLTSSYRQSNSYFIQNSTRDGYSSDADQIKKRISRSMGTNVTYLLFSSDES